MMTTSDKKIEDISLILKDLLKVIKIVSMYPEDNPLPQSLRRSFAEKLESIVDEHGETKIAVFENSMTYKGDVVFSTSAKEENLAGIFFNAGITQITFKPGLGVLEIYKLLDVIKAYINGPDKSQDLAALIWEAGVSGFALKTLEDVALSEYDESFNIQEYISSGGTPAGGEGAYGSDAPADYNAIFTRDEDSGKWEASELDSSGERVSGPDDAGAATGGKGGSGGTGGTGLPATVAEIYASVAEKNTDGLQYSELQETGPGQTMSDAVGAFGDQSADDGESMPNSALILNDEFKLSEEEEELIHELIEEDGSFEPYTSTLELLKEMLLQEIDMPGFSETITICEKVMGEFIRLAKLSEAGDLLEHLKKLEGRVRKEKPRWADRLKEAYIAAGSRGRFESLAASLNDNPEINKAQLRKYLGNFGWEALAGITELVGQLEHRHHRDAILGVLSEHSHENLDLVARGVFDTNLEVVRNAMTVLARTGNDKALSYLSKLVGHDAADIRMELVLLLRECPNEGVMPLLKSMVVDSEPQIRRAAVNAIVAKRGPAAFETITSVINDERFPSLERDDQQVLLSAFSVLGGDKALAYLTELITTYNHFRNRTLSFLRGAAFEALIVNRSEKVEDILMKLSKSWRPDIKRQAISAIHRRRENDPGE